MAEDELVDDEIIDVGEEIDLNDGLGEDFEEKDAFDLQFGSQAEPE